MQLKLFIYLFFKMTDSKDLFIRGSICFLKERPQTPDVCETTKQQH